MKKIFIFLAVSMVFVMLTSGLAFSVNMKAGSSSSKTETTVSKTTAIVTESSVAESTEVTTPAEDELLFYDSAGKAYLESDLCALEDGTYVYFTEDNVTRFAKVFTDIGASFAIDFVYDATAVPEYEGSYCYKLRRNDGGYDVEDNFDLNLLTGNHIGGFEYDDPRARVIAVFLELENCEMPDKVLFDFVGNSDFCSSARCYDPEITEGPSVGDATYTEATSGAELEITNAPETKVTTTIPQVEPWIPEGPGAEDLPWPEAPGAE